MGRPSRKDLVQQNVLLLLARLFLMRGWREEHVSRVRESSLPWRHCRGCERRAWSCPGRHAAAPQTRVGPPTCPAPSAAQTPCTPAPAARISCSASQLCETQDALPEATFHASAALARGPSVSCFRERCGFPKDHVSSHAVVSCEHTRLACESAHPAMLCSAANPELGSCVSGRVDDELPSLLIICGLQVGQSTSAVPKCL